MFLFNTIEGWHSVDVWPLPIPVFLPNLFNNWNAEYIWCILELFLDLILDYILMYVLLFAVTVSAFY